MNQAIHIPRTIGIIVLAIVSSVSTFGSSRRSRVYNAHYEAVWTAAADVANDAFLADRTSRDEGTLRIRSGPLRGYRFNVVIVDAGAGRTRVEIELVTNLRGVEKDAWRNGERYLILIEQRLQRGVVK